MQLQTASKLQVLCCHLANTNEQWVDFDGDFAYCHITLVLVDLTNCDVCDSMEWVEMMEPQSQELMYVNVQTGECVWRPPPGVTV